MICKLSTIYKVDIDYILGRTPYKNAMRFVNNIKKWIDDIESGGNDYIADMRGIKIWNI